MTYASFHRQILVLKMLKINNINATILPWISISFWRLILNTLPYRALFTYLYNTQDVALG